MVTLLAALVFIVNPAHAQQQYNSVYLEDLTWPEVRDYLRLGYTTIIVPTGGTEQNGPHLALGKHNAIVRFTAGEIARELGNALVAPVIAYVPEGRIYPPEGNMRFPGTISVSDEALAGVLDGAARSFKQHGFINIIFIGDHGGSQHAMQHVATNLSAEWQTIPNQVLYISNYYDDNGQKGWAASEGIGGNIQAHAAFADTSELLATDTRLVRRHLIKPYSFNDAKSFGVAGNPSKASASYGVQLLKLKVNAAVNQIKAMVK